MKRLLVALALAGCVSETPASKPAAEVASEASIGEATMLDDGTIVLTLRAEGDGVVGDGQVTYGPDDEHYEEVLKHLGGLRPGQKKPVPPWPE